MKIKKFEDIKKILRLISIALKHLEYSLREVKDYNCLTNKEKEIISEKDFKELFYLKEEESKRTEKTWYRVFKNYRKL